MGVFIDRSGQKFGHWLVVSRTQRPETAKGKGTWWLCRCVCGVERPVVANNLVNGHSASCGCQKAAAISSTKAVHGHKKRNSGASYEYESWAHMIQRCTNPKNIAWDDYGGRGIAVDHAWLTFENFIKDMGSAPSIKHSIERLDNNAGYSKENCIWATRIQQARNKRNNLLLTFNSSTKCLAQWCEDLDLDYNTVNARVSAYGWSAERALTTPTRKPYRPYAER